METQLQRAQNAYAAIGLTKAMQALVLANELVDAQVQRDLPHERTQNLHLVIVVASGSYLSGTGRDFKTRWFKSMATHVSSSLRLQRHGIDTDLKYRPPFRHGSVLPVALAHTRKSGRTIATSAPAHAADNKRCGADLRTGVTSAAI